MPGREVCFEALRPIDQVIHVGVRIDNPLNLIIELADHPVEFFINVSLAQFLTQLTKKFFDSFLAHMTIPVS